VALPVALAVVVVLVVVDKRVPHVQLVLEWARKVRVVHAYVIQQVAAAAAGGVVMAAL
jgi:hypothetical protein